MLYLKEIGSTVLPCRKFLKGNFFFFLGGGAQEEVPPSTLRLLQYYIMILQRPRTNVEDAGYEPEISASEVWRASMNEPPHP